MKGLGRAGDSPQASILLAATGGSTYWSCLAEVFRSIRVIAEQDRYLRVAPLDPLSAVETRERTRSVISVDR
jgi:hypothetical protein